MVVILNGCNIKHLKIANGRYLKLLVAVFVDIQGRAIPVNSKLIYFVGCTGQASYSEFVRMSDKVMLPADTNRRSISGGQQFFDQSRVFSIRSLNNAFQLHFVC